MTFVNLTFFLDVCISKLMVSLTWVLVAVTELSHSQDQCTLLELKSNCLHPNIHHRP